MEEEGSIQPTGYHEAEADIESAQAQEIADAVESLGQERELAQVRYDELVAETTSPSTMATSTTLHPTLYVGPNRRLLLAVAASLLVLFAGLVEFTSSRRAVDA
jgi:hypothetical protein